MRGASVRRNRQQLLAGIDLDVEYGAAVVVLGENGAGKTTLLRVLAGLMTLSGGTGEVLGDALPLATATRRRISAALDEPAFWPWMTAHGVVDTVADLSGRPRPDVPALLRELGLDDAKFALRRSKHVSKFSQGMRKRLQVACALSADAELLLLDEPTASLDRDGAELVWSAIERRRRAGVTTLLATHDLQAADRLGAVAVTLDGGRIANRAAVGG